MVLVLKMVKSRHRALAGLVGVLSWAPKNWGFNSRSVYIPRMYGFDRQLGCGRQEIDVSLSPFLSKLIGWGFFKKQTQKKYSNRFAFKCRKVDYVGFCNQPHYVFQIYFLCGHLYNFLNGFIVQKKAARKTWTSFSIKIKVWYYRKNDIVCEVFKYLKPNSLS